MKKLMMAVAIVCAAVGAQAAVASWEMTEVFDYADISSPVPDYAYANGYASYIVIATADFGVDEAKAAIAAGNYDWLTTQKVVTADPLVLGAASGVTPEWFDNEETVNAFGVIFNAADRADATYAYVTDAGTGTTGGEGQPAVVSIDGTNSYIADNRISTGAAPVPEPTSGLLLLLGVAGLALKRRRA